MNGHVAMRRWTPRCGVLRPTPCVLASRRPASASRRAIITLDAQGVRCAAAALLFHIKPLCDRRPASAEPVDELVCGTRTGDVETLRVVAAPVREDVPCLSGLDSLGNDLEAE